MPQKQPRPSNTLYSDFNLHHAPGPQRSPPVRHNSSLDRRGMEGASNPFGEDDMVCSPRKSQKAPAAGIDVLPDEALQHILSFLPSQEAVQTCVLAQRWRHLWIQQQLTSQHLMVLELSCARVTSKFLDFSSCPALKKLLMDLCTIHAETISSQSLEQLTIINCYSSSDKDTRTRIVAPSLAQLELTNNSMMTPSLDTMPSLLKAFIRLRESYDQCSEIYGHSCSGNRCDMLYKYDDKSDGSTYSVLLKGLSEAESLELVAEPGTFIFERDLMWCPIFGNLKTLLLNEWCVENDFQAVLCFLQHTPVLEKLILQLCEAPMNWVGKKGKYKPSKQLLASKKLKLVEIKCESFDERVQKIFCILSSHYVCIERINVQRTERDSESCNKQ